MPCTEPHYPRTHYDPAAPLPKGAHSKRVLRPRYDRKHCFTMDDILHAGLDYSLLQHTGGGNVTKAHNVRDRRQLAKQIGWEFLTTVLDSIIETGDHYLLPTRSFSQLRIGPAPAELSARRFRQGRYQMAEPFAHDFRTFEMRLEYRRPNNPQIYQRFCRVDLARYYKLCDLVNRDKVNYDLN